MTNVSTKMPATIARTTTTCRLFVGGGVAGGVGGTDIRVSDPSMAEPFLVEQPS